MQQFEIELNRCAAMLKAADQAHSEHDYKQSENLYHACLASLDEIYAGDSVTIADCLTGLGDSYYFQDKFGSALPMYERLLAMRERLPDSTPATLIKAHFKLAKTNEKLKNIEKASEHFKRGREISQQKLVTGHPLGTTLLEAYARFLYKIEPGGPTYKEVDEKARKNREVYLDPVRLNIKILEGLAEVRDGQLVMAEEMAKLEKIRQKQLAGKTGVVITAINWLKSRPRLALAILTLPISLAMVSVIGCAAYYIIGGEPAQQPLITAGQVYHTDDGHMDMSVLPGYKLKSRREQDSATKPFSTVSNAWRALYMVYLNPQYGQFWLRKIGDTLTDQNNMHYSLGGPGPDPLYTSMLSVAQEVYPLKILEQPRRPISSSENQSPGQATEDETAEKYNGMKVLSKLTYDNPYTHKPAHLTVFEQRYSSGQSIAKKLEMCRDSATLHAVTGSGGVSVDAPIACVIEPNALYLVGFKQSGAALSTCVGDTTLVLSSDSGRPFKHNCKFNEVNPASAATFLNPYGSVIVSTTTPDHVKGLCLAVLTDLGLMPFVILFGVILREQIAKWFNSTYVNRSDHGAHLLALVYIWFMIFYLAYTFFVLINLLAGFM